jgi:hypothetical protein
MAHPWLGGMSGFGYFVLTVAILWTIGTLIGVACLRVAISIYNQLARAVSSADTVPVPEFEKAALITFLTTALQLVGQVIVRQFLRTGLTIAGGHRDAVDIVGNVAFQNLTLPVTALAMALMLTALLPTTFGRALLVSLCYLSIGLLVFGFLLTAVIVVAQAT